MLPVSFNYVEAKYARCGAVRCGAMRCRWSWNGGCRETAWAGLSTYQVAGLAVNDELLLLEVLEERKKRARGQL